MQARRQQLPKTDALSPREMGQGKGKKEKDRRPDSASICVMELRVMHRLQFPGFSVAFYLVPGCHQRSSSVYAKADGVLGDRSDLFLTSLTLHAGPEAP